MSVLSSLEFTATLPRKRMAAGVLFTDALGRVLLVEPTYKEPWEIPGGTVEEGESPYLGATREVTEELGLDVVPGQLLVVDWVPLSSERTEGMMFIFDGGTLDQALAATIQLPADELRSWAWHTMDEAVARLTPLLHRRLVAALLAERRGMTLYLENGEVQGNNPAV